MFSKDCTFTLSNREYEKLSVWYESLFKNKYHGAIGGDVSITFTPTSVGMIIEAHCGDKYIVLRDL